MSKELITELKEGDKIMIGTLVLTKRSTNSFDNADGEETLTATVQELNAMGATLIKEPRKMTVWEWRNFPQVMFTIGNSSAYRWSGRFLEYSTSTDERIRRWNTVRSTDIEQLEAIGTEVL